MRQPTAGCGPAAKPGASPIVVGSWEGAASGRLAPARTPVNGRESRYGVLIVLPALQALVPRLLEAFTNHTYVVAAASEVDGVYEHVPPEPQPAVAAGKLKLTATPAVFCTSR